jgi:hypothetical protein
MRRRVFLRWAIILSAPLLWLATSSTSPQAQKPDETRLFDQVVKPFLTANCSLCHNAATQSGGLNFEAYQTLSSVLENRDRWERVLQKLRAGEMPPKGMPRPKEVDQRAFVEFIEAQFSRADQGAKPNPGRVTAHRLNRVEYNNTIRDLLGVDLRPADDFPQDDSGYGFDNISDVLSLSPALMESYLSAAEKVSRAAIFGPAQMKATMVQHRVQGRKLAPNLKPLTDYDLSGLSLPNALHTPHRFPVDGEYVFRASLGGTRPAGSEPLTLALWIDGRQTQVTNFDATGVASFSNDRQDFAGMTKEFRVPVTAGDHWIAVSFLHLYEGLPVAYGGPNPSKLEVPPTPEFKPPPNLPPERVEEIRKRIEARRNEKLATNDARIDIVEVRGPYAQPKGPSAESVKRVMTCGHTDGHHQAACATRIVASLAHRAYRRPVTSQEVAQLTALAAKGQRQSGSFDEGIALALQAILVSPDFLFRIEKDTNQGAHAISQHELATRLSYFLWSSMPDDELLQAADRGTLRQAPVLEVQVRRMLQDEKSHALVENFGGQWLELRRLESIKPDRQRFPEFEDYLRISMRLETEKFFENIIHEDRSIVDFIDGQYSFLNERLAQLYKIPGVKGPEFRKVSLAGTPERGGIFTQASVLTVSSYATRTSPVLRGKWLLENILNSPPPPPPPNVPNLDEAAIGSAASLRQQLEAHRQNPTCASCHAKMDPLGFGLENFNAIGAWRTQDGKFPIDASGTLPDGRSFRGPQELRAILKADRNSFTECLTEKMLTYALGRGLERYDQPAIKEIVHHVAANEYRFSSLVLEIVDSLPFQMRGGEIRE